MCGSLTPPCCHSCPAASSLAPLLRTISLPEWSLIALLLAELRPRTRGASSDKGTGSGQGSAAQAAAVKWGPYLRVLPAQTGTVLEWSDKEVGLGESQDVEGP